MNITVINGSPKGKQSVTLQTVRFWEAVFSEHTFTILHAGRKIKQLEQDFTSAAQAIEAADLVLFAYPVYTFLAPSQLHRFFDLLYENHIHLDGKLAAQVTTSKHFYDVTAHEYVRLNTVDLGMRYLGGLSADMDDLLTLKGQNEAQLFFESLMFRARNTLVQPNHAPLHQQTLPQQYPSALPEAPKTLQKTVAIVTNAAPDDANLLQMIEDARRALPCTTRVHNIAQFPFAGGCLGCFGCAQTGLCVYHDGFDAFLRDEIQSADAILIAYSIHRHSMGASFRVFDDRQFCNGHRPVTMGMPMGYLVSGDLRAEPNLRMLMEARCEVGHNFPAGIANTQDEIVTLAANLTYALEHKPLFPQNFYGVGGMKIFRDLIYVMGGLMRADHQFYKQNKLYDFPQKQVGTRLKMQLVGKLFGVPSIQKQMKTKMNEAILSPYEKVIEAARQK